MKKNLRLLIVFCVTFSFSQTPCESGFAGIYPCNDYDLLSTIPVSVLANSNGTPEGSDIWGWTDPSTGKEYALCAMTNSTAFVDISDPVNPIFLGRLDSSAGNNFWRDVKVYNNHAFIVADNVGAHGMQVFDLTRLRNVTNPPVTFSADAIYVGFLGIGSCHNIVINEDTAIAYLVGCDRVSGGPIFIDISNPTSPVGLGSYSDEGYSHDAQVVTYNGPDTNYIGREIYVGSNENEIVILDVTDKSNVVKLSELSYLQLGYTHQGWFTDDHRYFILGDEQDEIDFGINSKTLVFDMSDLTNPSLSSTYLGPTGAIDHNGYVLGNKYYLANYTAGMRVLDITNISAASNSMTEIGFFDTRPENDNTSFNGAWSVYPYFSSGNIVINDIERGLFVVGKISTLPVNTNAISSFSIYPNPATTNPKIKSPENTIINSVEVFNLLGQSIYNKQDINEAVFTLPLLQNAKGIYMVKINNRVVQKVILK
ncbi:MAG: choice-of-anchor B family protein [Winogradskyella sp.]|uniref:choice-of-anchor B family protein n=1 Tax=Winogradskyella sp. TaxID=1883156 RepID=UPI000F3BC626|nr:choice-of-anchor B family protein [Winogradskyella sp.]RNC88031.1 MAG: choice-of-anchor B family protein [Winogradskyella sp.]